jgi:hypothetical protein
MLRITSPDSLVEITATHLAPAFVNEFYRIDVTLTNISSEPIPSATVSIAYQQVIQGIVAWS